jgi:hypothetical protein
VCVVLEYGDDLPRILGIDGDRRFGEIARRRGQRENFGAGGFGQSLAVQQSGQTDQGN